MPSVASSSSIATAHALGESAPAFNLLYPNYLLDPITAALTPNLLLPGTLVLISIDMTVTQMTEIIVTQISPTQDFGMRCWLSKFPFGTSLLDLGMDHFPVSRMMPMPLIVSVIRPVPENTLLAHVQPGKYYLNILNLTNAATAFAFVKTDLA